MRFFFFLIQYLGKGISIALANREIIPEKGNLKQVIYLTFSGIMLSIWMICDVISSNFSSLLCLRRRQKRFKNSRKAGFEFVFKSGFFRNNRDKTEVSFLFFSIKSPEAQST